MGRNKKQRKVIFFQPYVLNNLFRLVALTFSGLVLFLKTYSFYCRWVPFLEYFFPGGYLVYSPAVLGSYFRVSR